MIGSFGYLPWYRVTVTKLCFFFMKLVGWHFVDVARIMNWTYT